MKMAENSEMQDTSANEVNGENETKLKSRTLGRRLSRRLSIITKVPSILNTKFKQDIFNGGSDFYLADKKCFDITVIAPDKTQRIVSISHK